ncbi:MAG: hypothetical protein JJV93_02730 [Alphaproteobacteria bacterium]|nr:hypothetical protein [Alphaproteobacteria bacterium]MBL0718144.1 hypothetical protein [Alphaproteobacteria bacterium]
MNDIDICSQALIRLGSQPIQSFDDSTVASQIASNLYNNTRDFVFSIYPWRFTKRSLQLVKMLDKTDNSNYYFELPKDCIRLIQVSSVESSPLLIDYKINGRKIFTTSNTVYIMYITAVDEIDFPIYFTQVLIDRLAMTFAIPLTQDSSLHYLHSKAFDISFAHGRQIDSQQDGLTVVQDNTLLHSRNKN